MTRSRSATSEPSLSPASAVAFLRARGVDVGGHPEASTLPGGVSSSVVKVVGSNGAVIVKRSLSRLLVDSPWYADRGRTLIEDRALRLLADITPDRVPKILDLDPESLTLVMECAPEGTTNWREALLTAAADPSIGAVLGSTLAAWHARTWVPWSMEQDFVDKQVFEQLRLQPFYEVVAERIPELRADIVSHADTMRQAQLCLVDGDFTPKNVLTGSWGLWIVDLEVAHLGHPAFDVGLMAAHIALTAVARPSFSPSLQATWDAFLRAYLAEIGHSLDHTEIVRQAGCLVLARTDGRSREPALDVAGQARGRRIGKRLLMQSDIGPHDIWEVVDDELA